MDVKPKILLGSFSTDMIVAIAACYDKINVVGGFVGGRGSTEGQLKEITWLHYGDPSNHRHEIFRQIDMIVVLENAQRIQEIAGLAVRNRICLLCITSDASLRHNEHLRDAARHIPTALYVTNNEAIKNTKGDKGKLDEDIEIIAQIGAKLPNMPTGRVYRRDEVLSFKL